LLRLLFLALLAGGLVFWAQLRRPRALPLVVDLSEALPGDAVELDVVITRAGRAVARIDRRYGDAGAPQLVHLEVRAAPGLADVEATLVYRAAPARRASSRLDLRESSPATLPITAA